MWHELKLTPDDNDTLMVTAPAFPEVSSFGETEAAALKYGRLAIEEAIAARRAHGDVIPAPVTDRQEGAHYVSALET